MAAIINLNPEIRTPHRPASRPHLTLIEGGLAPQRLSATYRRRRMVAALIVLVLAVSALAAGRAALAAVTPQAVTGPTAQAAPGAPTLVVEPGDSFWSIARRLDPTGDVRPLVDQLVALNGPAGLRAGERIVLPA